MKSRITLMGQWYKFPHPKGSFSVRKHGPGNWGYYVRDKMGRSPADWEDGREMFAPTYKKAVASAKEEADKL